MIFRYFLLLVPLVGYASSQAVASGGKDLSTLIGEITGNDKSSSVDTVDDRLIDSVFNQPTQTTTAPSRGVTEGDTASGIPGTGSCTCVPYFLCINGTINTNGEGLIDLRIDDNGPCQTYLEVCCDKDRITEQPITPTPPPTPQQTGCGRRRPDGVGFRIIGKDREAAFGEFPWMVAVLREESIEGNPNKLLVYKCGGALVHPQVVVTAAHCVTAQHKYKIRAGEWDTQHTQELYPFQDRDVANVVVHPQYYAGALYNDIALLYLTSPVTLAENVDVLCLPPQGTITAENTRCYATGWGKDSFGKIGKYQVILKKIDLPIISRDDCQQKLRQTRLGKHFVLHESFTCAGGELGKDTCKGDGGSPLVCPIGGKGDRYYHAGIVAWGIGCGETNNPGVYVNVAHFRDWIDQQMAQLQLDTTPYVY